MRRGRGRERVNSRCRFKSPKLNHHKLLSSSSSFYFRFLLHSYVLDVFHCWPTSLTFLYSFLSGKKIKAYMAIVFCAPFFPAARHAINGDEHLYLEMHMKGIILVVGLENNSMSTPTKPNLKGNAFLARTFTNKQS